jgi:hypothetical protein
MTSAKYRTQEDDWNVEENWDMGVPSGSVHAIIADHLSAIVDGAKDGDTFIPKLTGTLTLGQGALLRLQDTNAYNAVEFVSVIRLQQDAVLATSVLYTLNLPPIEIASTAEFRCIGARSHGKTTNFQSISGGNFIVSGQNQATINFNSATTITGLILAGDHRYTVHGKASGCFGTGDVKVEGVMGERSAQLYLEVSDTIHDDATLELSGNGYDSSTQDRITISSGVVEQIGRLIIDGEQKASGTYTKADGFIDGDGTLIVGTTTTTTAFTTTTTQAARTTTITTTTTTTTTITTQLAITTKITTTATPTPTTTPTTTATTTTTITSTTSTTTSTTTVPISRVSPWNCALNPEPVQVYESASMENAYDVSKLDFATGFYDFLYHIPMKLPYASGAPVSHWNSVGYNPIDSRMYATMKVDDADFFLVRFAENQLEFVAKLPVPPENSDVNEYNAGAFGHSGT